MAVRYPGLAGALFVALGACSGGGDDRWGRAILLPDGGRFTGAILPAAGDLDYCQTVPARCG